MLTSILSTVRLPTFERLFMGRRFAEQNTMDAAIRDIIKARKAVFDNANYFTMDVGNVN